MFIYLRGAEILAINTFFHCISVQRYLKVRMAFIRGLFTACGLIFLSIVAKDSGDVGTSYLSSRDSNTEKQITAQQRPRYSQ
jgi:hypothetical protein